MLIKAHKATDGTLHENLIDWQIAELNLIFKGEHNHDEVIMRLVENKEQVIEILKARDRKPREKKAKASKPRKALGRGVTPEQTNEAKSV